MSLTYKINQNLSTNLTEWESLLSNSNTATIFQTPEYLKSWVKSFLPNGKEIFIVEIFDGGKLVGFAPFRRQENIVTILGTSAIGKNRDLVTDFGDIVAIKGREKEIWETVILALKESEIKNSNLEFVRENSLSYKILIKLGFISIEMTDKFGPEVAPFIDLPKTWEELLVSFGRKQRHELRRKLRRLETSGEYKIIKSSSPDKDISDFIRLHKTSTIEKDEFMTLEMENFFISMVNNLGKKNYVNLDFMEIGGKNVASTLSFTWRNEFWLYNSGFDRNYTELAVGFLLKALTVKQSIESGYKKYNFLRGSERYKYDLGARDEKLYKIILQL